MTTQNRRPSFSSSTTSSLVKRHAPSSSSENVGKVTTVPPPHVAKRRTPLGNLTNRNATSVVPQKASRSSVPSYSSSSSSYLAKRQSSFPSSENVGKVTPILSSNMAKKRTPLSNRKNRNSFSRNAQRSSGPSSTLVPCVNKIARVKKDPPATTNNAPLNIQPSAAVSSKITSLPRSDETVPSIAFVPGPCSMDMSPTKSDCVSVSLDETMSTCDSFKSPEVEYVDNNDVQAVDSVNRETFSNLCISDCPETTGNICNRDVFMKRETDGDIVDVDNNFMDPQMCATIACDIYKHLRASEVKKRPSTDFMEKIQKDINSNMRAILIDWLVEVAEEYRIVPDTLYLTVNYIDRYLSGNVMNRQRLQLLGVACMMIASKYEEICAPQVEEFCYITDNTYFKEEILQMESAVLNYLKFELTAPTTKCFLRRFVRAAQGTMSEAPAMQLECMANYIAELSLLEYNMLCYAPSLIAASAIYLANFILVPSRRPWNSTLQHYTLYEPSDLCDCVKDLHRLCLDSQNSSLPAIREKHSQHKYKYVAKKHCPPIIPPEFFHN